MSPIIAEFIGTTVLILLGCGVVANVVLKQTKGNDGGWIVITTGWALAVYIAVVIAGPYSGAHINPAVSIGLAAAGKFPWAEVPMYILAQMIGAMLGATLVWIMYRPHFDITIDGDDKRGVFCNTPAISNLFSNITSEVIGTCILVFTILYFTDPSISNSDSIIGLGSLGALPVALLVWSIGLSLGGTTGYAINPARDLGPRIVHAILPLKNKGSSGWDYSWIPVLGPILGGVLAALLFIALS